MQVKHIAASNYFTMVGGYWRQTARKPQRRGRSRGLEEQSRHHQVPEGFVRRRSQGSGFLDNRKHVAAHSKWEIATSRPDRILASRMRFNLLRTDGGILAHERNCAAGEPGKLKRTRIPEFIGQPVSGHSSSRAIRRNGFAAFNSRIAGSRRSASSRPRRRDLRNAHPCGSGGHPSPGRSSRGHSRACWSEAGE